MDTNLIDEAKRSAGVSNRELADRAGTSRPTMSAYVHGRKVPRLDTAQRIVRAAGCSLEVVRTPCYKAVAGGHRPFFVPDQLPRLPPHEALAVVVLPIHLNWSGGRETFDLSDRAGRQRVYELVLREGTPSDIGRYVDGLLLADLWAELVLPREIRGAWQSLLDRSIRGGLDGR